MPATAREILLRAAPVLLRNCCSFKFSADAAILAVQNSKRYWRGASGKFITAYPVTHQRFLDILPQLAESLAGCQGPYILSDRRYGDCGVVYYRYGGFLPASGVAPNGERTTWLIGPAGQRVQDKREPEFIPPPWADDPFPNPPQPPEGSDVSLNNGRYTVQTALSFSNTGGVYLCRDEQTGRTCVVKEARPFTAPQPGGGDATNLLESEYRILQRLADTGVSPIPIELFHDWEHSFLAEEYCGGVPLRSFWSSNALHLSTRPTLDDANAFVARLVRVLKLVARALRALHDRGVTFGDLSPMNVLVSGDAESVRLIDFEAAAEPGRAPPLLRTPGFADPTINRHHSPRPEDDYYGLGALLLAGIVPVNWMLPLDPSATLRFLRSVASDYGLPPGPIHAIEQLMSDRSEDRSCAFAAAAELTAEPCRPGALLEGGPAQARRLPRGLRRLAVDTARFLVSTADFRREDRLYPADPKVFLTNPGGLAYGASGVLMALALSGDAPPAALSWLTRWLRTGPPLAPGLFVGSAGIAWALLALGQTASARWVMAAAVASPDWRDNYDLAYGAAGVGFAALKFYTSTGDRGWLRIAIDLGRTIEANAKYAAGNAFWGRPGSRTYGLAHGSAGIALFLLYLHLAGAGEWALNLGRAALAFDLANAVRTRSGGLTWTIAEDKPTRVPYWRYGSAGVGAVLLRFATVAADGSYEEQLAGICDDCSRKYTIFPGFFFGLAGIGDFWMDMHRFRPGGGHRQRALRIAEAISLFAIRGLGPGVAFPGYELMRVSCDLATGGAGVLLFLNRVLTGAASALMIDELLPAAPRAAKAARYNSSC